MPNILYLFYYHLVLEDFESYIDHVFTSTSVGDIIKRCSILSDLPTNVRDDYPLLTTAEQHIQSNIKNNNNVSTVSKYPRLNWSDIEVCASYSRYLMDCAKSLTTINFDGMKSHDEAQKVVYSMCSDAVAVMHEAGNM